MAERLFLFTAIVKSRLPAHIDMNECEDENVCGENGRCINTPGSHYCVCNAGYGLESGSSNFSGGQELCKGEGYDMILQNALNIRFLFWYQRRWQQHSLKYTEMITIHNSWWNRIFDVPIALTEAHSITIFSLLSLVCFHFRQMSDR